MKRVLSLLLAITLLVASGCAASSGNAEQPGNPADNTQVNDNTDTTPPADDEGENTGDVSGDTSNEGENTPDNTDPDEPEYTPVITGTKLGENIGDFAFTTYDGTKIMLSEVLAEKKAVLINIFATWCGPCKSEFPFMEEAYKMFQDKAEVLALSGDSSDSSAMIRDLAKSLKLTFPMGPDSAGVSRAFKIGAYPTTIVVDRFGTIVYTHVGSFPDTASFVRLFDFLVSDEYTESVVLEALPPEMPHVELTSPDELGAALGMTAENPASLYNWPMTVAEIDGRTVLVSGNQGKDRSNSSVQISVTATAGNLFAFDLKISSEEGYDFFKLMVNGEVVKVFSGERDWLTYAYEFSADGEYVIELAYAKDPATDSGEDTLWLDNARVLSKDEAAGIVNITYPMSDETTFTISNENVTRVVFEDPYNVVYKIFGCDYEAYLINGLEANCVFTLANGSDPDAAICYDNHELAYVLSSIVSGDKYKVTFTIDSLGTTGKGYTYVILDPDVMTAGEKYPIIFFADVEGLEKFVKSFAAGAWHDAEEWEKEQENQPDEPLGDVVYTIRCVDESGNRVAGVTLQVCNDSTCSVYVTDANGECVLTLPSDNYEIHVLKAPEGFVVDSAEIFEAPIEGGELTITLKHE